MKLDFISLSVIQKALENIAEEMGIVLRRASFSANCKERLDFSCAIFNSEGELVAQAEHIPVHLGAMFSSMDTVLAQYNVNSFNPGDIIILNSPFSGGTHLPDISFILPVFIENKLTFFVTNRAHHSDIGGSTPGSMPGTSTEIYQEGLIIPPVKLYSKGVENEDILNLILSNVRVKEERLGDFRAQRAALIRGEDRLTELATDYDRDFLLNSVTQLMELSEHSFRSHLGNFPDKTLKFCDYLDSNGITENPVKIQVTMNKINDKVNVSFEGTDKQQIGNVNCPKSVVYSCVYYVFRVLTDPSIMTNAGLFRNIEIGIPVGSLLDPKFPAAVSSGNVETSQRIVDVLLGALAQSFSEIPAASQGTMNNISLGSTKGNTPFTYYETLGGGTGAGKFYKGTSAIHSHMTNTLNTPIEAFELIFPFRVKKYAIRKNSGGSGKNTGGDGIEKEIECLVDTTVSIQSERRTFSPYGIYGGQPGAKGANSVRKRNGEVINLPGRIITKLSSGDTLMIKTPGGGGYGKRK
ncbi:5-oxoprolinase [Candidatus Heimdallarchaeota archaeon B3_Heim]|nr:MAG: 5-oxoprolinase [Candidatus Heimdallarchaeota archaeon B3_Heim]